MTDQPRFRFTLRDMLALTVIAAVASCLLSIFLGWRTPNSYHRAHCINNQRQVGIAILTHAAAGGGRMTGYRHNLVGNSVPWPVMILPNVGRSDIYDVYLSRTPVKRPRIEVYICPQNWPANATTRRLSYILNAGLAGDADEKLANGIARDYTVFKVRMSLGYIAQHDGTAQTLLFSENLQATTWDALGKLDTTMLWHATASPKTEHHINGGKKNAPLTSDTARPSSNHPGGVVMTFCDGHTRFINEQIDYKTYMQLMTPNGADSDMPTEWKTIPLVESELR